MGINPKTTPAAGFEPARPKTGGFEPPAIFCSQSHALLVPDYAIPAYFTEAPQAF